MGVFNWACARCKKIVRALGPGLIAGAADDDPAGVVTYTIAGAQHGHQLLYTAFLTWPLMAGVQMMCARIGMVTGTGLIGALRTKFPRSLILIASLALFAANTLNIGANLSGMADAAELLTSFDSKIFVFLFAVTVGILTVRIPYHRLSKWFKWLTLFLLAYVACALLVVKDWKPVWAALFHPTLPTDKQTVATLVAILGTTISPYLFFWQASQEVEEEKSDGRAKKRDRIGATESEISERRWDVGFGTFFSNLVMFFIILTSSTVLHAAGKTDIESSREAAEALQPLGSMAAFLYSIGIIGVGFLAIPTLSASAGYALAETFHWKQGLAKRLTKARKFYTVILISTALGVLVDVFQINPIKALFWSGILNGMLAPFLLAGILAVACDKKLMHGQCSSMLSRVVVGVTTVLMTMAALAFFLM